MGESVGDWPCQHADQTLFAVAPGNGSGRSIVGNSSAARDRACRVEGRLQEITASSFPSSVRRHREKQSSHPKRPISYKRDRPEGRFPPTPGPMSLTPDNAVIALMAARLGAYIEPGRVCSVTRPQQTTNDAHFEY